MPVKPKQTFLDQPVSIKITPNEIEKFLRNLATDDDFRSEFERDPRKVFAEYHVDVAPGQIPSKIKLPTKEKLQEVLEKMLAEREALNPQCMIPQIWFLGFLFNR